jgi:hypothetical protein
VKIRSCEYFQGYNIVLAIKWLIQKPGHIPALLKNKTSEAATSQLEYDNIQQERAHHQMLVKEHGRLQQRCENLQNELGILRAKGVSVSRSTSNASSFSIDGVSPLLAEMESEAAEETDEKDKDEKELVSVGCLESIFPGLSIT